MPISNDLELHLVNTMDEVGNLKRWLSERHEGDIIGLDTETSGLNPWAPGARIRMVQVGDSKAGWAIPWELWGGAAMEVLTSWEGRFALHNAAFDAKWLRLYAGWELPWDRTVDTMIEANMLLPGERAGLKDITDRFIDPRASLGQEQLKEAFKKNNWDWNTVPIDFGAFYIYSALDPVLAVEIHNYFRADVKYPEAFDLEMSTLRICEAMEYRGVPVDVDYCLKMKDTLEQYVVKSKEWAKEYWGINIGASGQLGKFFQDRLGARLTKRTAGGQASMDKEVLENLELNGETESIRQAAKFVNEVRKADKIRSSYLENFIKDQTDGILHSNIKTMRAKTGRMSITNPALQTLGKNDTIVRNAIVARDNEYIVSVDLDQVEFRVFAHLSQDENLIKTFFDADRTGSDAFTEIGRQIYGGDFQKSDKRRGLVKNTIYGMLYGAGVAKMAQSAGVPVNDMKVVHDDLLSKFPGISRYQRELDSLVGYRNSSEGAPYIETVVTGRKIPVEPDRMYAGLNYTIQSTAAEVFKRNLCRIDAAGLGDYLLAPVHDEAVLSVPKAQEKEIAEEVKLHMTTTDNWAVPLTAGAEWGQWSRWGEKYLDH